MVANLTANISPTLLNEFMFSYTTDHIFLNAVGPVQRPSSMTMTGLYNNGFGGVMPAVKFPAASTTTRPGSRSTPDTFPGITRIPPTLTKTSE